MLKRINDENKKTKEVLDKIDRGEFKKEKRVDTVSVAYHRKEEDEDEEEEEEEDEGSSTVAPPPETTSKSRVSFSGSWATDKAEDITWATSMEQKRWEKKKTTQYSIGPRYPIVVFNPNALSKPTPNPAGCRSHHSLFHFSIRARFMLFLWDTKVQHSQPPTLNAQHIPSKAIPIIIIIIIIIITTTIIIITISRYHLTFKIVQADAKIVSQIFHAHGFHEVAVKLTMVILLVVKRKMMVLLRC